MGRAAKSCLPWLLKWKKSSEISQAHQVSWAQFAHRKQQRLQTTPFHWHRWIKGAFKVQPAKRQWQGPVPDQKHVGKLVRFAGKLLSELHRVTAFLSWLEMKAWQGTTRSWTWWRRRRHSHVLPSYSWGSALANSSQLLTITIKRGNCQNYRPRHHASVKTPSGSPWGEAAGRAWAGSPCQWWPSALPLGPAGDGSSKY